MDNLTTCTNLNLIQSSSNNSICSSYHLPWQLLKKSNVAFILTWIGSHASFEGNDVADTESKWISSHIHTGSNQRGPPDFPSILYQNTPLPVKTTNKHTKHLNNVHKHNNIHLSLSTIFFLTSSWFSRLDFTSVNVLFSCKGHAPHYSLKHYTCRICLTNQPIDLTSFPALCPSQNATHLRQLINNTWSAPGRITINKWFSSATIGKKRNYSRTLAPASFSNALRTPSPNTT